MPNLTTVVCIAAYCVVLSVASGINLFDKPVEFIACTGVFALGCVMSYKQGLERGGDIARIVKEST